MPYDLYEFKNLEIKVVLNKDSVEVCAEFSSEVVHLQLQHFISQLVLKSIESWICTHESNWEDESCVCFHKRLATSAHRDCIYLGKNTGRTLIFGK